MKYENNEFSFIEKYLAPLSFGNKEALGLKDDAAIITPQAGYDIIITKDAITEGTHFFKNDSASNIARKLLRSNLSDLAAKGATPYCCFLALILPKTTPTNWLEEFSSALKDDLQEFGCFLAGGDTCVHDGTLTLTLTALGKVKTGTAILRKGAKPGDLIFVTGDIGDSYLGLQILKGGYNGIANNLDEESKSLAISRYHTPLPRLKIGLAMCGIATSAIDISDGLVADLTHICALNQLGAAIHLDKIPLSPAGIAAKNIDPAFPEKACSGGDDYELLFTAPAKLQDKIAQIAQQTGIKISHIGEMVAGNKVKLLTLSGEEIAIKNGGYLHNIPLNN